MKLLVAILFPKEAEVYRCSAADLKEFAQGRVWQAMKQEIALWRESILADLSAPTFSPTKDAMTFAREDRVLFDEYLRGCLLALERFETLPGNLAAAIEDDIPEPPNNEEDLTDD